MTGVELVARLGHAHSDKLFTAIFGLGTAIRQPLGVTMYATKLLTDAHTYIDHKVVGLIRTRPHRSQRVGLLGKYILRSATTDSEQWSASHAHPELTPGSKMTIPKIKPQHRSQSGGVNSASPPGPALA